MDPNRWRKIEQLFYSALERESPARPAFLAEACNGDEELRQEVDSLLARNGSGEQLLDHPAWEGTRSVSDLAGATYFKPGTQLGPYRIDSLIGAGGMGQVYRAHDTRLDRDVALKFLASSIHASLERFRREAQAISALSHPNICTIHDIGEYQGQPFLVMELLEGHDLRQRIAAGRLPLEDVLAIGIEICKGLQAAHARGIVHRDIKPANIFLTSDGGVKILDFGLAKSIGAETASLTETGSTLGTLAYMAPEQARGQDVDARSDLFSLGAVLYEMAAGQPPFSGSTPVAVLDAILNRTPVSARVANPQTPGELDRIISKAIHKDRKLRYQTASDLKADLELARPRAVSRNARRVRWWPYSVPALLLLLLGAAYVIYRRPGNNSPPGVSQWIQLTAEQAAVQPALSPDGRMLAFLKGPDTFIGKAEIYVKRLPDGIPVQLTHDGTMKLGPAFSPDGSQIAYTAISNRITWNTWTVPVSGGAPRLWLTNATGLKWIDTNHILFSEITERVHMLLSIAATDRTSSRVVYEPPHDRGMVHRSSVSPDRKWAVLAEMDNGGFLPCRVVPMDGSSSGRRVGPPEGACTDAAWSPDGHWLYLSSDAGGAFHIWRQRFPYGSPEQLTFGPTQEEGISVAPDGKSLVTSAGIDNSQIWVHGAPGERQISPEGSARIGYSDHASPHPFSSNGRRLFYLVDRPTSQRPGPELWETDLGTDASRLLFPGTRVTGYDIAPNGQDLAYASPNADGKARLWSARLDHRAPPRSITDLEADDPCFAADGTLFFRGVENRFNFAFRLDSQSKPRKVVPMPIITLRGCSPDAQWLLVSVTWPDPEVPRMWVAYPVSGGQPAPICNDCWPQWSRDGRILYVRFGQLHQVTTYALPIPPGSVLPKTPSGGITAENVTSLAPVHVYEDEWIYPGANLSTYALIRSDVQRNIYRIPLH